MDYFAHLLPVSNKRNQLRAVKAQDDSTKAKPHALRWADSPCSFFLSADLYKRTLEGKEFYPILIKWFTLSLQIDKRIESDFATIKIYKFFMLRLYT